jgi:hypothetical protein
VLCVCVYIFMFFNQYLCEKEEKNINIFLYIYLMETLTNLYSLVHPDIQKDIKNIKNKVKDNIDDMTGPIKRKF